MLVSVLKYTPYLIKHNIPSRHQTCYQQLEIKRTLPHDAKITCDQAFFYIAVAEEDINGPLIFTFISDESKSPESGLLSDSP